MICLPLLEKTNVIKKSIYHMANIHIYVSIIRNVTNIPI